MSAAWRNGSAVSAASAAYLSMSLAGWNNDSTLAGGIVAGTVIEKSFLLCFSLSGFAGLVCEIVLRVGFLLCGSLLPARAVGALSLAPAPHTPGCIPVELPGGGARLGLPEVDEVEHH